MPSSQGHNEVKYSQPTKTNLGTLNASSRNTNTQQHKRMKTYGNESVKNKGSINLSTKKVAKFTQKTPKNDNLNQRKIQNRTVAT